MTMALFNPRWRVNLVSFFVSFSVIFVAVKVSDGSFATRINKISENLDKALAEVIDEKLPVFSNLTDNATYVSDCEFRPRGMAGLYNFTKAFMDLILSKDIYPEGFLKIENNEIKLGDYQKEWKSLLGKYAGLLTMIVIIAFILVLMPVCGFCFCCCRCCGKCGARSQPFDKKHDLCKKIILASFLICLGTLLLFGVVCAFSSNQQMQDGVDDLTDNLRKGITDINTYLDTTKGQVHTLLNLNYMEFQKALLDTINESNDIVYDELANYSNATSMTELAKVVLALPSITNDLNILKYSTNALRIYASQLNDAVRKVKKDLLQTLRSSECQNFPKCQEINNNISNLHTNIHFNSLPDITEKIEILNALSSNSDLNTTVQNGQQKLEEIRFQIGDTVNKTLDQARIQIHEAGNEIRKGYNNISAVIDDLKIQIDDNTKPILNTADEYIDKYAPYRYYGGIAVSCILLCISLCVALGLVCGICGKRPEVYGDDCCNKGAGSRFLICGVMLMFLTGFVIAAVVLVTFLLGTVTQRIVCDPMNDPENSQVFDLINQVDFSQYHINLNISQALTSCYRNDSIYNVFQLEDQFNLTKVKDYLNTFNISEILGNLNLDGVGLTQDFKILEDSEKELLKNLAESDFAVISFDEFKGLLENSFTNVNLSELSSELGELIGEIEDTTGAGGIVADLQISKMNIDTYQEKIVQPMIVNATAVVEIATKLDYDLKLNHSSFQEAIFDLLGEVNQTEIFLRDQGQIILQNIATNFTDGIISQIQTYLDRIVDKTNTEVGQCGPLNLVIRSTLTATCDKILLPWNGFWFGLFWSMLLFIPTIFVSVKLATLYQKYSPYSGPLVEAEYLYDAYADRDSIPMNSRNSKSKKKNKKYKRYEDRPVPSAAGDMVSREYTSSSNQDTRYADMAPKQWEDFPAGGPPQYQRAHTEYDRPPPYYYPGAGENQQ